MTTIAKQLETQYPDSNRDQGAAVEPLSEVIVGDIVRCCWCCCRAPGCFC